MAWAPKVQILDGFSALASLDISGASYVNAGLLSNPTPLEFKASGASSLTLKSGRNVSNGYITGASHVTVATPSFEVMTVSGASTVKVDGTVGVVSASGASVDTASGIISGAVGISGGSVINGDLSGTVQSSGGSTINGDVSGNIQSSRGSSGNAPEVVAADVIIPEQPMTLSGTSTCYVTVGWITDIVDGIIFLSCFLSRIR